MAAINRVYFATQAVNLKPQNADGTSLFTDFYSPKGVQSVGMTTNFNLEQLFQLGQLEVYDQPEQTPDVEVTISKLMDGTPPLYLMCMGGSAGITGAVGKTLANLGNNRVNFRLGIFADDHSNATGSPDYHVDCSGMYLSSFTYTFPVDGTATEDVTLVGNNKLWGSGLTGSPGAGVNDFGFTGAGSPVTPIRRFNIDFTQTVLPTGDGGIRQPQGRVGGRPYVQTITVSSDLGREAINEFGAFAPYHRYINFPVEVTSDYEVIASDGDHVEANDFASVAGSCGTTYSNVSNKPAIITVCTTGSAKCQLDLGEKNKLLSVNYTGGDATGGNATISYSFRNFNDFVMNASGSWVDAAYVDTTNDAALDD
jgi:hypothetical protein